MNFFSYLRAKHQNFHPTVFWNNRIQLAFVTLLAMLKIIELSLEEASYHCDPNERGYYVANDRLNVASIIKNLFIINIVTATFATLLSLTRPVFLSLLVNGSCTLFGKVPNEDFRNYPDAPAWVMRSIAFVSLTLALALSILEYNHETTSPVSQGYTYKDQSMCEKALTQSTIDNLTNILNVVAIFVATVTTWGDVVWGHSRYKNEYKAEYGVLKSESESNGDASFSSYNM